jgi:photosystem II stability/assembly factor-like uncharacterized protein
VSRAGLISGGKSAPWRGLRAGAWALSLLGCLVAVALTGGGTAGAAGQSPTCRPASPSSSPVWTPIGPEAIPNAHVGDPQQAGLLAAGRIQAVAIDLANPQVIYAGGGIGTGSSGPTSEAGISKTTNGGASWTQIDTGLTDPTVDALWLDQNNPQIVVASTWFGGIYRSTNAGSSWASVYPVGSTSLVQVGTVLYAATDSGVASSSSNNGMTWALAESTPSPDRILAAGGGALYAGLDNGSVMAQAAPGDPWQTVLTGLQNQTVWDVAVNPTNGQNAIVTQSDPVGGGDINLVTNDGGAHWSTWSSPPQGFSGGGGPAKVVAFDTVNPQIVYAGSGGFLFTSTNGGSTWTQDHMAEDLNLIDALPGEQGSVIVGGDQGIYMSVDQGSSWTTLNGNLTTSLLTGLAVNGQDVFTAVQDFSPTWSLDGGSSWLQLSGPHPPLAEDGSVAINPGNPSYWYAFTSQIGLQVSSDGGQSFSVIGNVGGTEFTFPAGDNEIAIDPEHPSDIYLAAKDGVFESTNWGDSWSLLPWSFSDPFMVVVSPTDSQTIFVGGRFGLFVTHNGGSTWTPSSLPGLSQNNYPATLAVDPANASIVVAGEQSGPTAGGGLFRSTDGGSSFSAANGGLDTSQNTLADHYAWKLSFQPTGSIVVAATDDGIYDSSNGGTSWTSIYGTAIPCWFSDVAWDGSYLYASTFGEGVVRTPASSLAPAPTITSFTPTSGPVGTSVTIRGTNFTGATGVTFNGTPATSFGVVSPTVLKAVVPAGATSGKISVTTAGGIATSIASFTVTKQKPPTIGSFSPTRGPVGTLVTISGTNFSGVTSVRFNGTAATVFTVVSSSQIRARVPVGATTGRISVATPGGTATSFLSFTVTH